MAETRRLVAGRHCLHHLHMMENSNLHHLHGRPPIVTPVEALPSFLRRPKRSRS
ncbi:hypothetical protein Hanom_Chr06g00531321 [Helianthus anomalus]